MSDLSEEEAKVIFTKVLADELPVLMESGMPDRAISRDELIKLLGDSTARMIRATIDEAYEVGHRDGYSQGYDEGMVDPNSDPSYDH